MSRWNEIYPECRDKKADCLSYKLGRCSALRDTKFTRPCPFYCTAQMVRDKLPDWAAKEVLSRYGKSKANVADNADD